MQEHPHKYEIELSQEQRHALQQLISKGKAPARKLAHAGVLQKRTGGNDEHEAPSLAQLRQPLQRCWR
jgi:hypothetical protein